MLRRFVSAADGRVRVVWRLAAHTALVLVGYAGGAIAVWSTVAVGLVERSALTSLFALGAVLQAGWLALVTWAVGRWLDRRSFEDFIGPGEGAHPCVMAAECAAGAVVGGALIASVAAVESALGFATYSVELDRGALGNTALLVALFAAVAFSEELWFRGYVLTNIADAATSRVGAGRARVLGLALSSLGFGAAHVMNPEASVVSTANIVLAGVFLGLVFAKTGRLAFGVGVHFAWNLAQAVLDMPVSGNDFGDQAVVHRVLADGNALVTGGPFGPEAGLLGLAAMAVGTLASSFVASRIRSPASRSS